MSAKIQYICCPNCGGVLNYNPNETCPSSYISFPNKPKCSECGREYVVKVHIEGTMKIEIKEEKY